jgi:cytochrome c oxidase subunit II
MPASRFDLRRWRTSLALAGLIGASLAQASPLPESGGMPRDISADGWRIDRLVNMTIVFIAILFAIMVGWMLWACIRHGRWHTAAHDSGTSSRSRLAKAGVAALIFAGVDGNLFVNSTMDLHSAFWNFAGAEADPAAVRIEVNAHQWAWVARYAGPDGAFNTADDVVSLNDIRVPVQTPIIFQLVSTDVIHCFYIPNLRVKQDVVPGQVTRTIFKATQTGEFDIACGQHCGTNHYKMKGRLTVLSHEDYDDWLRSQSSLAERAYDPDDAGAHWGWKWRSL